MDFKKYIELASRTRSPLKTQLENNIHMILGMLTEVGELADSFKKNMAYNKEIDWINVKEEVSDILWYIANFIQLNNLDIDEILEKNIKKLETRYPNLRFDENNAIKRNLEKERFVLEK